MSRKKPIRFHSCKTLQWMFGKQLFGAYMAILGVSGADDLIAWLDHLHDKRTTTAGTDFDPHRLCTPPQCSSAEWLALYRDHRRVLERTVEICLPQYYRQQDIVHFWKSLLSISRLSRHSESEYLRSYLWRLTSPREVKRSATRYARGILKSIKLLLEEEFAERGAIDETEREHSLAVLRTTPELQFFMRIWVPCFGSRAIYPAHCLRDARNPVWKKRESSLKYLLSLDKGVVADPRIADLFFTESHRLPEGRLPTLQKWLSAPPAVPALRVSIKYSICAAVHLLCELLWKQCDHVLYKTVKPHRITYEEIYDLFQCMREDRGLTGPDPDFPPFSDVFIRMVRKHQAPWKAFLRRGGLQIP